MKVEVDLEEVIRVFNLIEKMQAFMHQTEKYNDLNTRESFMRDYYPEVHSLYYDIVWDWLPEEKKKEIEER